MQEQHPDRVVIGSEALHLFLLSVCVKLLTVKKPPASFETSGHGSFKYVPGYIFICRAPIILVSKLHTKQRPRSVLWNLTPLFMISGLWCK